MLFNPGFECSVGVQAIPAAQGGVMQIPSGWTPHFLSGTPWLASASMHYNRGGCGGTAHVEKIEGSDSLALFAHDLEWSAEPGKPFDVAVYQQVAVTPGVAYSVSGWMLSLCGGSSVPNDCPEGYYMAKLLGLDPTGGVDPTAPSVVWTEDRRNFITAGGERVGWVQLSVATTAVSDTLTVFARIRSPFRWHGNHAFIDAVSLVEAPQANLIHMPLSVNGRLVHVRWEGRQSERIETIPGGSYALSFDLQVRPTDQEPWQMWRSQEEGGAAGYAVEGREAQTVHFRVRAHSAQPPPPAAGAWPNHRYVGAWSLPSVVAFNTSLQPPPTLQMPMAPIPPLLARPPPTWSNGPAPR